MTASPTRKRRSTRTPTRTPVRQRSTPAAGRGLPRPPSGAGNIIGMVLLVVAAFVAGYLIGRARPAVMAVEEWLSPTTAVHENAECAPFIE